MSTKDQVIAILADQAFLDPSDVSIDSTLEQLGFVIEEAFDISVPFNANQPGISGFDITSVASIVAGVERLRAEQA